MSIVETGGTSFEGQQPMASLAELAIRRYGRLQAVQLIDPQYLQAIFGLRTVDVGRLIRKAQAATAEYLELFGISIDEADRHPISEKAHHEFCKQIDEWEQEHT